MRYKPAHQAVKALLLLLPLMTVLQHCLASGGSGGTGITQGTITGFGSLFVNNIEYDISQANMSRNGIPTNDENHFSIGEFILVEGSINPQDKTGIAHSVSYHSILRGPVTANSNTFGLEVLGQKIVCKSALNNCARMLTNHLVAGDFVEISGTYNADKQLVASSIKQLDGSQIPDKDPIRAKLYVDQVNLHETPPTIIADQLTIIIKDNALSAASGDFIEVTADTFHDDNRIIATGLQAVTMMQLPEGTRLNLEGIITAFESDRRFSVNGRPVHLTDMTRLSYLSTIPLSLNSQIEVSGLIDSNGVLIAEQLIIEDDHNSQEINGTIDHIDYKTGSISIFDQTLLITDKTQLVNQHQRLLKLTDLSVGDWVEIYLHEGTSPFTVETLEHSPPRSNEVEGLVTRLDDRHKTLEVLGISITTDEQTIYTGPNGNSISSDAFFRSVIKGRTEIDAEGNYNHSKDIFEASRLHVED